jgi:small subunit ribosomal protein S7
MARRRRAEQRETIPDPKHNSELVGRMISYMMQRGKKTVAERIVYGAMDEIAEKLPGENPLEVVRLAIDNVKPRVEVRSRRVGGATYQVPVEVGQSRQMALAMRWLAQYSSARKGLGMQRALALELMDAYKNQGNAVKKRDDTHKMAQANKAFAHYAW